MFPASGLSLLQPKCGFACAPSKVLPSLQTHRQLEGTPQLRMHRPPATWRHPGGLPQPGDALWHLQSQCSNSSARPRHAVCWPAVDWASMKDHESSHACFLCDQAWSLALQYRLLWDTGTSHVGSMSWSMLVQFQISLVWSLTSTTQRLKCFWEGGNRKIQLWDQSLCEF